MGSAISIGLKTGFADVDAKKKAKMAAKCQANRMSNINGDVAAKGDESGEGSAVSDGTRVASGEKSDTISILAQPSHLKV